MATDLLYNVYDGEELIAGETTNKEMAKMFGISIGAMSSVTADILTVGFFKGKRIEAVSTLSEKKRVVDSDFADEWDRVRFMLNPHAKKA